ncbi:MAG TPA: HAD family phosphatase [Candidatus Binataceae bacterium]|jgi:HAD superfamily hydrolase (TIGR01549 family)|nr:HAD family phosphatase [Candidatus Binataceae bacterium]
MSAPNSNSGFDHSAQLWMFDFDNTLVALEQTVDWALSRTELEPMLREAGCPAELFAEFPRGNLGLYDAVLHRLQAGAFTPAIPARELLQRASHIIEFHELAGVDRAQALPGAAELLTELVKRNVGAVIVTSNSSRTVYRWLARTRLVYSVRSVVGRDSLLALKPAPDMLLLALERNKVEADSALFVGDSDADRLAATAAGVRFFAIAPTQERRTRMSGVDAIFASPAELLQTLGAA